MKRSILTSLWLFIAMLTVVKGTPFPGSILPRVDSPCKIRDQPGFLKVVYENGETEQKNNTQLYRGILAVTNNDNNRKPLKVQFEQCTFPGYGYEQGSSRNSGGSMGAPLEYFGIVKYDKRCLTASTIDVQHDPNNNFHFQTCSTKNNLLRLKQFFVLQIGIGGTGIAFVGAKNTRRKKYQGAYSWTIPHKSGDARPRTIRASYQPASYGLAYETRE